MVGVLADLTKTLKQAKISVFAMSTYDTDWIMLKRDAYHAALHALSHDDWCINEH